MFGVGELPSGVVFRKNATCRRKQQMALKHMCCICNIEQKHPGTELVHEELGPAYFDAVCMMLTTDCAGSWAATGARSGASRTRDGWRPPRRRARRRRPRSRVWAISMRKCLATRPGLASATGVRWLLTRCRLMPVSTDSANDSENNPPLQNSFTDPPAVNW